MKKVYALLLGAVCAMTANADMYVIGNFNNWTLADATALMTETAPGVYTADIADLLGGFKFNDGTWSNPDANWGGGAITLGEAAAVEASGSSGNITFADFDGVADAHIVLDTNACTVTVTGNGYALDKVWYLAGSHDWAPWDSDSYKFEKVTETTFTLYDFNITEDCNLKVTTANWVENYGAGDDTTPLAMGQFSSTLVYNGNDVACSLRGSFDMTWDFDAKTLTAAFAGGVQNVDADNNAPKAYYNLQGVRVDNPSKGLYIVKQGNKATKAYIF